MIYNMMTTLINIIRSPDNANEILPRLWLGNYHSAHDPEFIRTNNINMIINCTKTIPFIQEIQSNFGLIETYRIPVNDSLLQEDFILMEKYFRVVIPLLLRKWTIEKKNILIHCHAGKQRSAIVAAALLKVLLDNNYINLTEIPKGIDGNKQFEYICNYLLLKRPNVFTYGFRINFQSSFKHYFNLI